MKKFLLPALTALGLSASALHAASFEIDYQQPGNPFGSQGQYAPVTISSEVFNGTYYAGGFNMTAGPLGDFVAFCIEVTRGLQNGATYQNNTQPFDASVRTNVQNLFNSAYDQITDHATSAAFQVALWEITGDSLGNLDLSSGTFSATEAGNSGGSVVSTAQGFLDNLESEPSGQFDIDYLLSQDSQNLVTANRVDRVALAVVPLPASGLLFLAAGGLFLTRRKKA